VVTTDDGAGGAIGITVNSFTSVSLEPPLVLWCLDDASDRRDPFVLAERFVVNILARTRPRCRTASLGARSIGSGLTSSIPTPRIRRGCGTRSRADL
jgi:flavin reductase (DIM6/NTAB) family NADH-FMN oxidoreductase RutF